MEFQFVHLSCHCRSECVSSAGSLEIQSLNFWIPAGTYPDENMDRNDTLCVTYDAMRYRA